MGSGLGSLLQHMRQFMRQKPPAFGISWPELSIGKDDVVAHRVSEGPHFTGRLIRLCVGMNSDVAEIMPEPILHEALIRRLQGLPWSPQNFLDNRWRRNAGPVRRRGPMRGDRVLS